MDLLSGLLAALIASAPGGGDDPGDVHLAQLRIRQQLIIRVPARPAPPPRSALVEKRGPSCVKMADLAGAAVVKPDSVDFILRGGIRIRARFDDSCPALDYYTGFYVLPTADGRICTGRDAVHDRSGNTCTITRLRLLVSAPAPR